MAVSLLRVCRLQESRCMSTLSKADFHQQGAQATDSVDIALATTMAKLSVLELPPKKAKDSQTETEAADKAKFITNLTEWTWNQFRERGLKRRLKLTGLRTKTPLRGRSRGPGRSSNSSRTWIRSWLRIMQSIYWVLRMTMRLTVATMR